MVDLSVTNSDATSAVEPVGSARARPGIKTEQGALPYYGWKAQGLLTPGLIRAGGRAARGRDECGFKAKGKHMNNDTTNQVIHGDCAQVLCRVASESIDAVITAPPYLVGYRDRSGRSIANDSNPAVLDAFSDLYRILKPNSLCVCLYGWNRVDAFFRAWRTAGFQPVGHLVWAKSYASRTGFLEARHEQAYLLAKGHPQKPHAPLPDVQP